MGKDGAKVTSTGRCKGDIHRIGGGAEADVMRIDGECDQLNRIVSFERGTLSASGHNGTGGLDTISSPSTTNNWNYDALGNWTGPQNGSQSRTFNAQNQIASITGLTTPTYDNNGNATKDQAGNTYTFNAWNPIVGVTPDKGSEPE